ncbi:MAG: hypothetical protein R2772_07545 [Chitinophagales bacterium]
MMANMNVPIAAIGLVSLIFLFGLPLIKNKWIKMIPAPMIVILIAIPLGIVFDLAHEHTFTFMHHVYHEGRVFSEVTK